MSVYVYEAVLSLYWDSVLLMWTKARFPFKRNRLRKRKPQETQASCVGKQRNKRKRQPIGMLGRSSGNHNWLLANASACVSFGFRLRNACNASVAFEWKPGFIRTENSVDTSATREMQSQYIYTQRTRSKTAIQKPTAKPCRPTMDEWWRRELLSLLVGWYRLQTSARTQYTAVVGRPIWCNSTRITSDTIIRTGQDHWHNYSTARLFWVLLSRKLLKLTNWRNSNKKMNAKGNSIYLWR